MNLSVKKIENWSTFGKVMDNIVVPCFFDSQCILNAVRCPYVRTSVTVGVASSVANDVTMKMTS